MLTRIDVGGALAAGWLDSSDVSEVVRVEPFDYFFYVFNEATERFVAILDLSIWTSSLGKKPSEMLKIVT
jgi:hypothetical protein